MKKGHLLKYTNFFMVLLLIVIMFSGKGLPIYASESGYLTYVKDLATDNATGFVNGGEIVAFGEGVKDIIKSQDSITGKYLSGEYSIPIPEKIREGNGNYLQIRNAHLNNLKNIDLDIPTGKIVVLRMGNLQNGRIVLDKLVYTSDPKEIERYPLEYNDLLFNRTNSKELVGKVAIYKNEIPAIYAGYLVRLHPILIDSDYLNYVMQSQYYWIYCQNVRSDAIGQSNINAEKLKRFVFPLPPLLEQRRIVDVISRIMTKIEHL